MTATNTNKQPVFVDRPLLTRTRLTNQVVGNSTDLNVQGGQSPSLLVDMDATLSSDNNSGGVIDSITILRDDTSNAVHVDYIVNAASSGTFIGLTKGQIVYVENTGVLTTPAESGQGYYTYTGDTALNVTNTEIHFSGVASPTDSGFTFTSLSATTLPAVTFVVYHTRGTTVPIPADGDYVPVFSKTVPTNSGFVDCSDVMPELATPVPQQGNTTGLGPKTPLKNRGIYLQRGDRLYVGVLQRGVYNTASGYIPGAHIIAQGGFY
tara:strand:+ start:1130 stop:1924 length:795 start_codon:yes stop_codon:yes gene_type:complete